jgi:hypothetical protein
MSSDKHSNIRLGCEMNPRIFISDEKFSCPVIVVAKCGIGKVGGWSNAAIAATGK